MHKPSLVVTTLLTALTLFAFAANSILCRAALANGAIDPATFSAIRIASGALVLVPWIRSKDGATRWRPASALALSVYALAFSFSYLSLDAGMGALLLFGSVQLTMLGVGWLRGERPSALQSAGIFLALCGVVWLVLPGVSAPPPLGAFAMAGAGVAWGVYSLLGRGESAPAVATARNFFLAVPLALTPLAFVGQLSYSSGGVALAATSGALTSGLGYVLWYAALRGHSRTSAAVVQLLVPVLAALGGLLLLQEALTRRLLVSALLTLGGVGLAIRPSSTRTD